MAKIDERVSKLVKPPIEEKGIELVDIEYVKEGNEWYLRIFIDKLEGITLDDCELISRLIDPLLDEIDYIPMAYHLEVSSPGLERPLKTTEAFQRFLGQTISVTTYNPIENKKKHLGKLMEVTEESVTITTDQNADLSIPREKIAKANLVWMD